MINSEILVNVYRGDVIESTHRGSIAVVDSQGNLIKSLGDPETVVFMRSCAKPLQALPVIESGAADKFDFTEPELACMSGSLNGQDFQVDAVRSILSKISLSEDNLLCGVHRPSHRPTAKKISSTSSSSAPIACPSWGRWRPDSPMRSTTRCRS